MRLVRSFRNWLGTFLHSIRFRLTMWFVLILGIVLAVFSVFIYFTQARDLQFDAAGAMQEKFAHLQAYFRSAAWQNSDLSPSDVPQGEAPLQQNDLLILTDATGEVLQNWGMELENPGSLIAALISNQTQRQHELTVYQQNVTVADGNHRRSTGDYLFIITPVLRGDRLVGFLIVGSPSQLNDQLRRLMVSLLFGSLGMLAIAFFGGLWLADRAMRPVRTIARTAQSISESDLNRRIDMKGRDELAELAGTFDAMLARLQAAFDRQRRFVADASHELRTPLTIINLEVGRVLAGHRSLDEYQHALQIVNAEGERMTRLVSDLMTLARMDAGQTVLHFEELDLSDVALEAAERLSALAERQQIRLEMKDLPELLVHGDRQYLVQMVSNLIENAVKYSGPGQTVQIETGPRHDDQQDAAMLRVSDHGPGIPSDHLPRLFDRFYRVDQARTHNPGEASSPAGSGLGLSIVAWIVQSHGGEIHVQSKVNEGSVFEVTLPLQKRLRPLQCGGLTFRIYVL
jgi:two-component system OmpR family sensor kinase